MGTKEAKKQRLLGMAKAQEQGGAVGSKKPLMLKHGLNHVTSLIESKQAKLVVIAHDVDPLEMVIWLPALCRKKDVPYCIIKGKARLGTLVEKKTAAAVAVTSVKREDQSEFEKLCENFKASFNDNADHRRRWGRHHGYEEPAQDGEDPEGEGRRGGQEDGDDGVIALTLLIFSLRKQWMTY